ncbi:MAG: ribose-phosphate pyrophosphokinase-like domain-containing protein, partial [Candidatus Baltobacteraceae bacterium]
MGAARSEPLGLPARPRSHPLSTTPLLFSGSSNPQLAEAIAKRMKISLGDALVTKFKNEETRIEIREN